jgi:hypothetical protein
LVNNKKLILNFKESINWQVKLNELLEKNDIELVREELEILIMDIIQERFCGFLKTNYDIYAFLNKLNSYINSINGDWNKEELKLKRTKLDFELVYHDYTYSFNMFKKEVDFYDSGTKIFTYKSEWVKANIGDEHSICIYALKWVKENGQSIFEEGYEIRKK